MNIEQKLRLRNLGINVKCERLKKCISQQMLAETINISHNTLSLIERGKICPNVLKIIDIAEVLEIDIRNLTKGV